MDKQVTAQELYNNLYFEMCARARDKGQKLPDEVEVFSFFVKSCRDAILVGEAPPDFLDEVREVQPHKALEREASARLEARDKALREGSPIDLDDLL